MIRINKEGYPTILLVTAVILIVNFLAFRWLHSYPFPLSVLFAVSILFLLFILRFFRDPKRFTKTDQAAVVCPADGKVVVIEEAMEPEYFKDKRLQVSIFMSPFNVHVNRHVISGIIQYVKYHPGKYLVAWHPKSSTENERNTIVYADDHREILVRQIAGKVARKIVCYSKPGEVVKQGDKFGFIKFGSRVDIFLPLGTSLNVQLNQIVVGGETLIASFLKY